MNDPVFEIGGKDLSGFRVSHDKADRFAGCVIAALQRFCERNDACAQVAFEFLRVHGASLSFAAVDISLENVFGG